MEPAIIKKSYGGGGARIGFSPGSLSTNLQALIDFYPGHIEKEDKIFFPASRAYFTDEEDQAMLAEFLEFDRKMIHEKYRSVVEGFERRQ